MQDVNWYDNLEWALREVGMEYCGSPEVEILKDLVGIYKLKMGKW